MSNLYKIFVYGTLKRGQPNHNRMVDKNYGRCNFVCEARTTEKYPLVIATCWNLPFLMDVPGVGEFIHGEIYEIDDKFLKWLDDFECLYLKKEISVEITKGSRLLDSKRPLVCQAYFLNKFPQGLLNLPHYSNYDSYGPHNRIYCPERDDATPAVLMDALLKEVGCNGNKE